jgi:hypothetical protein
MERIRFQRAKQSLSNSAVKTKARKNIKTEGKKVKRNLSKGDRLSFSDFK